MVAQVLAAPAQGVQAARALKSNCRSLGRLF